ncbi:MAG: OmpA family protein [Bacteroidales bacterium]|nr:OmpA family protein [Bacteroidales bacterium]
MRKVLIILAIIGISLNSSADIPPLHFSIGYTFARSPLSDFNEFIGLYNENPQKLNNYVFTNGFDKMHWLTGIYFEGGFKMKKAEFEINFTRKFNHTFAYYDPANNPTYFRIDIGIGVATIETAILFPTEYENFTLSPGIGLGFLTRNYYYWQDQLLQTKPKRTDMVSYQKSNSVSLDPMLQFSYRPFENLPFDLTARLAYQMMFTRMPLKNLYYNKGYWTPAESEEKSVSCGNLSLTVAVRYNLKSLKLKTPEEKVTPPLFMLEQMISGNVKDAQTGNSIDAVVTLYADGKPVSTTISTNGAYSASIKNGSVYTIETKAFGYKTKTETITAITNEGRFQYDIQLEKIEIGKSIQLENILFEKASAVLLPESFTELDKLYKFLLISPEVVIEIAGHTSSDGDEKYNQRLSQDRANSIAKYLIDKGISSEQIIAKGYGESRPIADNDTEEGRKQNRRVEFKILKI